MNRDEFTTWLLDVWGPAQDLPPEDTQYLLDHTLEHWRDPNDLTEDEAKEIAQAFVGLPDGEKVGALLANIAQVDGHTFLGDLWGNATEQFDEAMSDADSIIRGAGSAVADVVRGDSPWVKGAILAAGVVGFARLLRGW